MNTTQLRYFMELSKTLNYSTAAQQLFITQPTLSRSIMALEDEVGAKLFYRENGNVSLTPAGRLLVQEIGPLAERYDVMMQRVKNRGRGLAGELSIAISNEQQMPEGLIGAVRGFIKEYPNVEVQFRRMGTGEMTTALREELIDLSVGLRFLGDARQAGIESLPITQEAPCLVRPALGHRERGKVVTTEECRRYLMEHTLVFPSPFPMGADQGSPVRALQDMLHLEDLNPDVMYVSDPSAVSAYVAVGLGVTITNRSHTIARESGIEMLEILGASPYEKVMQHRSNLKNPVLERFLAYYQEKQH